MYLGQFGAAGNYATDTTVTVHLFTTGTNTVTGTTEVSDITELATVDFTPFDPTAASFAITVGDDFYTSVAADVGSTVFMGITLTDDGNNVFPRIDVVSLSVTAVPEPTSLGLLGVIGLVGLTRRKRT